jgi:nitrogen regulatory protein PII
MTPSEAKKIEIVTEAVRMNEVCDLLDELGATGYTVLPVIAGRGRHGRRRSGDPTGLQDTVMIVAIVNGSVARAVLDNAERFIGQKTAVMCVSTVTVLRADHF